jgi:dipeptidase E
MTSPRRVLLLSNSTQHGRRYLDHAEEEIVRFLEGTRRVVFFPYALSDRESYARQARDRFAQMGIQLDTPASADSARFAIDSAECFFTGGGNTFRLLRALQDMGLVDPIRSRVAAGAAYIGSSAGSIVAGPNIRTTKDMPIVEPRSFSSLALVPFQISPHYLDPDPASTHMGETQEERIRQFHEENDAPVAGLREGSILRVEGDCVQLCGVAGARLFRRGEPPAERLPGTDVTLDLLQPAAEPAA